ncbi:hypothetical protein [Nocardiopsis sp. Huas11]|nr:hypothetical protein [Nocardiopsis sp. Huas11]
MRVLHSIVFQRDWEAVATCCDDSEGATVRPRGRAEWMVADYGA